MITFVQRERRDFNGTNNATLDDQRKEILDLESTVDRRIDAKTRHITKALKQTQKQSWTDPLTKLNNRRLLDERLGSILTAQLDAAQDLSIVMFDVDHFKQTNDRLGHSAGDALLVFIGELFRGSLRETDLAVRYGGDEFVLILPATSAQEALAAAERILMLFGQHASTLNISPKPSLSAGIASLRSSAVHDGDRLLQFADEALYRAKQKGRSTAMIHRDRSSVASPL